jgi:hypothetical protein
MTTQGRKRLVWLVGVLILLGGYVGSFFALRRSMVNRELTALDLSSGTVADTSERIELTLYYFSTSAGVHRTFYAVYYPIHALLGSDGALLAKGGIALRVNPKLAESNREFYVANLSDLRFAESGQEPGAP